MGADNVRLNCAALGRSPALTFALPHQKLQLPVALDQRARGAEYAAELNCCQNQDYKQAA